MITAAQLAANRRNALRSTGPRTLAGKARADLDALTAAFQDAQRRGVPVMTTPWVKR